MVPVTQIDRAALLRLVYESLADSEMNRDNAVEVSTVNDGDGQDSILVRVGRAEYQVTVRKIW